jgi:hypothetical protein
MKDVNMGDLDAAEVKALADAIGLNVPELELPLLVIRLNGMIRLLQPLEALPLDEVEPIPTLFTQWGGS